MTSLALVRSRIAVPLLPYQRWVQAARVRKANAATSAKRLAKARLLPAASTTGALLACAGILLVMLGVRLPATQHKISKTPPAKTAAAAPPAKTANECADNEPADGIFATCPGFATDYSDMTAGSINTNDFTVYTGAPEANHEAQFYTAGSQNLRIENGSLVLEAQNEQVQGYKYTSARINTQGKHDFLYGKIVVRAKLPAGIGTWPAIWMLPSNPKYASLSPGDPDAYMNDGEIDIAEAVGTQPNVVYGIAHSRAYPDDGVNRTYFNTIKVPGNDANYHDYEVDWTPDRLTFRVDGQVYFTYSKKPNADWYTWPFDQPFYLIINLAVGGSWGGTDTRDFPGDGVDKSALPAMLSVRSIAYYPYIGQ